MKSSGLKSFVPPETYSTKSFDKANPSSFQYVHILTRTVIEFFSGSISTISFKYNSVFKVTGNRSFPVEHNCSVLFVTFEQSFNHSLYIRTVSSQHMFTLHFFIKFVSWADSSNIHRPSKWTWKYIALEKLMNKPPSKPATFQQEMQEISFD